jgi:hypothetical protein
MIAAGRRGSTGGRSRSRRRILIARGRAERLTRQVDKRVNRLLVGGPRVRAWTGAVDRRANTLLVRSWPPLARVLTRLRRLVRRAWALLRPWMARLFRALAALERRLLRGRDLGIRAATRASAVLTPQRGIGLVVVASAACLAVAQFVEYRAVEIGQPGYAGLSAVTPPTEAAETAGEAHVYLLLPVALLAAMLAMLAVRNPRRRGLGRVVFALGALSLAVALLVDLPAGLDAGAETSRFSGATAVLLDGFYAEIAAAAGLMLGGALLSRAPRERERQRHRLRKPSLASVWGGLAKRARFPVRERDSRLRT